jgi:signal transduction histidine kinase
LVSQNNIVQIAEGIGSRVARLNAPDRASFRRNELLAGLPTETYATVTEQIEIVQCAPNEIIFEEDDPGDSLYLIAQGSVKISKKGRAGQQETLVYLMEQDFFGEMALVDNVRRSAQAAAVGDVVLGRIERAGWDQLLRLAPHEVLSNFTKSVTKRLRGNNQRFIEEMMRNERLSLIGTTISSVVHDMNNPLSCITLACEVLRGNAQDEKSRQMAGLIQDAVGRMNAMTRELLDFSRGNTNLNLQELGLGEMIHDLQPDFAKCRPAIDVRVEVLYDAPIKVDRHRLLRVFGNLIRNAQEAMTKTDKKMLRFSVKRIDGSVHFEISDTGCGIPAQLLPRVFEPFVTHGKSSGTGLGLAISKSVVEAHGGSISVKSSEGGTTFEINLPLQD